MTSETPVHDLLLPRVTDLVNQAVACGIQRDVAVAVLINIITAPSFDTAEPEADSVPRPDYQRSADVVLVDGFSANVPPVIGGQDEADFVKPLRWDR